MDYAATILEQALAAITGLPSTGDNASAAVFFDEDASPALRLVLLSDVVDADAETMDENWEPRIMVLSVNVYIAGHDVQTTLQAVRSEVSPAMKAGLELYADCVHHLGVQTLEVAAEQDRETLLAEILFQVEYFVDADNPANRVY